MSKVGRFRWQELVVVGSILLLAIALRFSYPEAFEFKRDEANLSILALDIAHGKSFPLLGITSSVGLPNAPLNAYVLAIPYFFSDNPVVATWFVGLLNVLAIGLTYVFIRRYVSATVAVVIILLFAVSPWGVIFSRKIWAQNMLPFFVSATMFTGVVAFMGGKKWAQVLHPALIVFTGQIHYGAFVIVPALAWLWMSQWRSIFTRYTFVGCGVAVLLMLPYLAGLAKGGFLDFERIAEDITAESDGVTEDEASVFQLDALREAFVLFSGTEIHSIAGTVDFERYLAEIPFSFSIFLVIGIAVAVSVAWLIYHSISHQYSRRAVDVMIAAWCLFPIVIYNLHWTEFYIHYLIPALPAGFIALAFAVSDTLETLNEKPSKVIRKRLTFALVSVIVILATLQAYVVNTLFSFLRENQPSVLSFYDSLQTALSANSQIIVRSEGQAIGFDDTATVFYALLYGHPFLRFEDSMTWVYQPNSENIVIEATADHCNPNAQTLRDNAGNALIFSRQPEGGCYHVYERTALSDTILLGDLRDGVFTNGVEITGYNWDQVSSCLRLQWRIGVVPESQENFFFAIHGFDEQNNRVAVADGLSWFTSYWQPGTEVMRQFCLTQEVAMIGIGMYTLDNLGDFHSILRRDGESFFWIDLNSYSQIEEPNA